MQIAKNYLYNVIFSFFNFRWKHSPVIVQAFWETVTLDLCQRSGQYETVFYSGFMPVYDMHSR